MKAYAVKVWTWFKALPWYYKVVAVPVLLLLVVLGVLLVISRILSAIGTTVTSTGKLDSARAKEDKVETQQALDAIKAEEKIITEKKEEIVKKLEAAGAVAEKTQEDTAKIKAATTMAELDILQKELGL